MKHLIYCGCLLIVFVTSAHDYRWTNLWSSSHVEAQKNEAEKLVSVANLTSALYIEKSSKRVAQIHDAYLLLNNPLLLKDFNFEPAIASFRSFGDIEGAQKSEDINGLLKFNSLIFGLTSSVILYHFFKPLPVPLFFDSITCLALSVIYYGKIGHMYCKGTESQKISNYLWNMQQLQKSGSTV